MMISRRIFLLLVSLCSLIMFVHGQTEAQRKAIAITIDDLPLNGPNIPVRNLEIMTSSILDALRKHDAPAVGFVNESLLFIDGQTDLRISLLRSWVDAGVELGNHTYAHVGFRDTPLEKYEDDFVRGDAVTAKLQKKSARYFRHPFLQMGPTRDIELAFEKFIEARGCRIAPITISTEDWMFLAAYQKAKMSADEREMKKVSDEYLRFAQAALEYREKASDKLFGRQISQILLLHANEVTSANMDRLLQMYKDHGYRFVTLESALKDPSYSLPPNYTATSDWLQHWATSKGEKLEGPTPPEFIQKAYADAQSAK